MRALLIIATGSLLLSPLGKAQQKASSSPTATPSGLECVDKLETPEFPKAALDAHVDGSVWTWTQVTPQGTADKVDTQVVSAWGEGPKLLTPPVEKALKASKFKSSCAGKTVSVVFRYELHGEPVSNPKVTTRTDAPNIMYIESQPAAAAHARTEVSKK